MRRLFAPAVVSVLAVSFSLSACASKPSHKMSDKTDLPAEGVKATPFIGPAENVMQAKQTAVALPRLQKGAKLTLEDAAKRAISWHPSVNEAVGRINEAAEGINTARAGYYPQISGGIGPAYDINDDDALQPQLNLNVSQMLYDFGKVSNSVEVATANTAENRARLLLTVDELVRDTVYAVTEVQRNRALKTIALEQISAVEGIGKLVESRTDKGASTRSDELQAEARVQAAQSKLYEIDTQLGRWESQLATLIGSNGPVKLTPDIPPQFAKACEATTPDWSQVPSMMQADARRKEASAQLALVQSEGLPTLSFEVGGKTNIANPSSDTSDLTIGLRLSGKLYDGGLANSQRNAANHALQASQAALDNVRFEVGRNLLEAHAQTGSLERLLASLQSRDKVMRETRDIYQQQYLQLGTRTLLDLLNADQELHQARFTRVSIEYDLRKLWVSCLFNTGGLVKALSLENTDVRGTPLKQQAEESSRTL